MENFFREGFVCWRHECAQQEYEARSRNWIWLDKFTSYVIIYFEAKVMQKNQHLKTARKAAGVNQKFVFTVGYPNRVFKPPRCVWDLTVVSCCRNFIFVWKSHVVTSLFKRSLIRTLKNKRDVQATDDKQSPREQGEERNSYSILPLRLLVFKLREVWVRGRERVCPTTTCSLWLPQAI